MQHPYSDKQHPLGSCLHMQIILYYKSLYLYTEGNTLEFANT